jgi:DNA-directed RNA polymerase specialized sigma24 family protein
VLTGDQGLAEDLAQTALARAYASWPRIRRAGHPDAYVRRVMVNPNHSRFRKRRVAEQAQRNPVAVCAERHHDPFHNLRRET